MRNPCTEANCERQLFKDGLCQFHYMKWATNPQQVFSHIKGKGPEIRIQPQAEKPPINILGTIVANLILLWLTLFLLDQIIRLSSSLIRTIFG